MKRSLAFVLLWSIEAAAQLTTAPPPCPNPGQPAEPPECTITATNTGWNGAINCLNALVRVHPTLYPVSIIGYQKDSMSAPVLYAKGVAGTGLETGDTTRIAGIASMTKPMVYAAGLKLIQDHLKTPDCARLPDGTRGPRCVFPDGVNSKLDVVLQRLDQRNGTDIRNRWFNNDYLQISSTNIRDADKAVYDDWKRNKLLVRHLFVMTAGFPTLIFMGHKLCGAPECPAQKPGDVLCPPDSWNHAAPHTSECGYALLYTRYLELRGGFGNLPDACRPRPNDGPRVYDFVDHYNGEVYNPTRIQQRFERRYIGTPFTYGECVYVENPSTGTGSWVDGRQATTSDVGKFYLGLPLQHQPGTVETYQQAPLHIVSHLIEALSGFPFNVYLKQKFFVPLGMTNTFIVPDRTRPQFAPGGPYHRLSHASADPNNHALDEGGTPAQLARVLDVKRVPTTPLRDIPDLAPGLQPNAALGPDKHWDEGRFGWLNMGPEGGAYSTATDVLKFLRFLRNGQGTNGNGILDPAYLSLLTNYVDPVSSRTFGFARNGELIGHGGMFGGTYERDKAKGLNLVILGASVTNLPHGGAQRVPLCDFQYADRNRLMLAIEKFLQTIP